MESQELLQNRPVKWDQMKMHNLLIIENPEKLYIVENKGTESTVDLILRQQNLEVVEPETDQDFEQLKLLGLRELPEVENPETCLENQNNLDQEPEISTKPKEEEVLEEVFAAQKEISEENIDLLEDPKQNHCKYCQISFPNRKKQKSHQCSTRQSILGNQNFVCNVCGKTLLRDSYTYHMSTHSERESSFKCTEENCTKSFFTNQHLKQHLKSHSKDLKYSCPECDKKFVQKHHQQRHLSIHTGQKKYKCDFEGCGQSFLIKHQLIRHQAVHGIEPPMYQCKDCLKVFSRHYYLIQHEKIHKGEASFRCQVCNMTFAMKQHFVAHSATHSSDRPFKCDFEGCFKSFTLRTYLTQHKSTHDPNKKQKFSCETCQKRVSRKIDLQRHQMLHDGVKLFICHICAREFCLKSYLTNHLRIHDENGKGKIGKRKSKGKTVE